MKLLLHQYIALTHNDVIYRRILGAEWAKRRQWTVELRRPSESHVTVVSRKGMVLSFSISMVKRMVGCWLFRCCKNPLTWSRSETVKESSTYRFQILGLQVDLLSPVPQILVDSGIEIPEAWIPTITQHNNWSMRTYEGTPSSNRNNNENRNAPIAANQRATNSDT